MENTIYNPTNHRELLAALQYEIYRALGLKQGNWKRYFLDILFNLPLMHFIQLATRFDSEAQADGFAHASRRLISNFMTNVEVSGAENLPRQGPLVVVSNHPGSLDALTIAAQFPRQDVKLVARDMPFLRRLSGVDQHMIYSTRDTSQRLVVLRQSLRHLETGGSLILFASGRLDPDPAWMPGAIESVDLWNPSIGFILKHVPDVKTVIAITSRLIDPHWLYHPLLCLCKNDWDRQFLAELIQNCLQLTFSSKTQIPPRVSFSRSFSLRELPRRRSLDDIRHAVIEKAKRQMLAHIPGRDGFHTHYSSDKISGPSSVMAIECSNWAESEPSAVTTVH